MDFIPPLFQIGRWAIMEYRMGEIHLSKEDSNEYLDASVNKVFALLGVYEDCEKRKNFESYIIYINRLITEFSGFHSLFEVKIFLSIVSILKGMTNVDEMDHKTVKSLTFHCISMLKKAKVV